MARKGSYGPECFDLHVHSSFSSDGKAAPRDILKHVKSIGLGGVAIADHNSLKGCLEAMKCGVEGVVVIPAMEVTSSEGGHILALGVLEPVPRGLSPPETVERIKALGGIAIAPHPYRFWSGLGEESTRAEFDIVEVLNARSTRKHNQKARGLAESMGAGMTGGSDAHDLGHIGLGRTRFPHAPSSADEALQLLAQKRTEGEGTNRPPGDTCATLGKACHNGSAGE